MNVAIVGAGGMGRAWTEMLSARPDVNIRAFVDLLIGSAGAAAWLENQSGAVKVTALSDLPSDSLDAVIVTALSPAHTEIVRGALERGLNVLVEKPFVTTLADAEMLVALAEAQGKTLMVSQNYRFFPGPLRVRELLAQGDYGEIRAVVGRFWCDWAGKPYQHEMLHPMALEMAIHHFDLARAMFGAEALGGHVAEWNPLWSPYRMGGALEALFEMKNSSSRFPFLYSGSLVGKAPRTPWGGLWRFEFEGATLVADEIEGQYGLFHASDAGLELLTPFGDETMAFAKSFEHFRACLETGDEPWPSGRDNLGTLKMALAYAAPEART